MASAASRRHSGSGGGASAADGDDENASARKRFMLKPTTKNALIDWMIEVKMVKHEKPNQEEAKKDIRRKASDLLKEKRMDATREHFVFDLLDEYHQHHQTEANDSQFVAVDDDSDAERDRYSREKDIVVEQLVNVCKQKKETLKECKIEVDEQGHRIKKVPTPGKGKRVLDRSVVDEPLRNV